MGDKINKKSRIGDILFAVLPVCSVLLVVMLWYIGAGANDSILPSPTMVVERMVKLLVIEVANTSLAGHILVSLIRVFQGLALALVLGIPMGIMIGWNKSFAATVGTFFELVRPIPALAWIPLLIMWFGIGEASKLAMIFIGALMPIVVNSYTAVRLVPPLYIEVGKMFNAVNSRQILTQIVLPASLPTIFAGIRNSTSVAWMCVLTSEMLAAKSGLGFLITRGMDSFDIPLIMCGMILIGIIGALLAVLTNVIERKLCPWNRSIMSE